jgi:hypothetical protein
MKYQLASGTCGVDVFRDALEGNPLSLSGADNNSYQILGEQGA